MKRIRYFKQADGSFKTKQIQIAHDVVTVTTKGLEWSINDSSGRIVQGGIARTHAQMKQFIKKALIVEGAGFFDEIRNVKRD